jgi:hypothetical protein
MKNNMKNIDFKYFKVIESLVLVFWGIFFIDVKWIFDFDNNVGLVF